jgi:hypothetical protein
MERHELNQTFNQTFRKKLVICEKARGFDNKIKAVRGIYLFLFRNQQHIFALRPMKLMITSYGKAFELKRDILQQASRITDNIDNTVDKTLKYYTMVIKNLDKWSKTIHKNLLDEMVAQYHTLPSNLPMDLKSYVVGFITPQGVFH